MRSRWSAYPLAFLAVAVALAIRAALTPWLGERVPFVTLFGAVIVAAWLGGGRLAVLAALAGYVGAEYLFVAPIGGLAFRGVPQVVEFVAYLLSSALIGALGGAMQRARRAAEENEERFRGFMQNTPNSVFLKDETGRYLFMNRAAEQLVGRSDWAGRADDELLPAEVAREMRAHDRRVLAEDAPHGFDLTLATPRGERLLHSVKFPLRDAGGRRFVASITMDVTEQSRSEAQLQFVTDTMSAAVIRCDAYTRILWVNRVYCHWMKRDTSDIVGRPLVEVIGERAMEEIRPHIDAVLSGERPSYERLADFPGLGRRWVAATYTPTFGNSAEPSGWISVVYDIHDRKETQEQLGILLDALPMAVLRVNRDETYEWVNAIYAQWLGMPARDIVGRRLDQVLSPDQLRALRPYIERVLAGEQVRYERLAHMRGLGERWVRGVFTPINDSRGRVSSWVVITADVQEEKRLERALREADRRKDEFIATLAHELRNPLAPIRNAVSLLAASGGTGADAQWSRAVIERQVDQMSRLIDDLLDIARISSGKLLLRRQRVALKEVLDIAMETSQPHIESARHRLAVRHEAGEIALDADPTRLAQVFSNLLNNAAKYTPPGGSIGLDVTRQGAEAIVCVTDNGMGFPPSLAALIFEPFSQWAGPEHARAGLGLGLALVRAIVQLHGGSVTAASLGEGRGSRFEVRLPIAGAAAQPAAAPGQPEKRAPRLRVMVADDNRDAADSLSRLLALYGHEVRVAYDGLSAIELAREFSPLVAVLDIGMPDVSGYDVARRLREQHGRSLKLIALTGWGQQADRKQAADAGFDRHVTKPIDPRVLNEMICEL